MKCLENCPLINGSSDGTSKKRTIIRHPMGNFIQFLFPVTTRAVAVVDGSASIEEAEQDLAQGLVKKPILELAKNKTVFTYEGELSQNKITFTDWGKLPLGIYDITLYLDWGEGGQMRYKKRTLLQIVDETDEGGQYENDEFNVVAIYPIIKGKTTAIILGDDEVVISEAGQFKGDENPNDSYADVTAQYGDSSIEIGEDDVTLNI
jgi:hypothetical protein